MSKNADRMRDYRKAHPESQLFWRLTEAVALLKRNGVTVDVTREQLKEQAKKVQNNG